MTEARRFGEELRRLRQERNISLADISRRTKVSETLYVALERGDCSRWPSGIYSRSYVRDYAVAVGLDPERTVAEFAACFVETSAPDGSTIVAAVDRPRAAPADEGWRLSLDTGAAELWREAARRAMTALGELIVLGTLGAVVAITAGVDYWRTLASVAMVWLAMGRMLPILGCVAPVRALLSLPCVVRARVRSFTQLDSRSSDSAVLWPRPHQRS